MREDGAEVDAWVLSWLFEDLPLVRSELAQEAPARFVLTLPPGELPAPAPPPALLAERLVRVLARLGFAGAGLRIVRAELPRAAKPRPFVCRVAGVV